MNVFTSCESHKSQIRIGITVSIPPFCTLTCNEGLYTVTFRSGCGWTGVYIALDTLLHDLVSDRPPDDVSLFDLVLSRFTWYFAGVDVG